MESLTATYEKIVQPFDDYQNNADTDLTIEILSRSYQNYRERDHWPKLFEELKLLASSNVIWFQASNSIVFLHPGIILE